MLENKRIAMQKDYEAQIAELKRTHAQQMSEITSKHQKEVEQLV